MKKKFFKNFYITIIFIFLFFPIAVLFLYSFNDSSMNIIFEGFTLRWYKELFQNIELIEAFKNTMMIALISTLISTIIGTLGAVGFRKYDVKGEKLITKLLYIPIVIPEIVLGISLLSIYTLFKLKLSLVTILISHVVFSIPYVMVSVKSSLNEYGDVVEKAAYDLGASNFQTFFKITLPAIMPGVRSGALLAFTLSLDDVIISYFTAGPGSNTLPLKIYSMIKTGVTPDVYALTSLMLIFVLFILTVNMMINVRKLRG